MEIYRGSVPVISIALPTPDTSVANVVWTKSDGTNVSLAPTVANQVGSAVLPYQQYDDEVIVNWSLTIPGSGNFVITEHYNVVTPLLPIGEIKLTLDDYGTFSDTQVTSVERAVRHIVESFTGQSFGKHVGVKTLRGTGEIALALPERLLTINSITGYSYADTVSIAGDGWFLAASSIGMPEIRADDEGINIATVPLTTAPLQTIPITAPSYLANGRAFPRNAKIAIDGEWGWNSVPEAVSEAARLLCVDYAGDAGYRDKYLQAMTAADWSIEFNPSAFVGTGNIRADQLLSGYVARRGWKVL